MFRIVSEGIVKGAFKDSPVVVFRKVSASSSIQSECHDRLQTDIQSTFARLMDDNLSSHIGRCRTDTMNVSPELIHHEIRNTE